jgi:hypothetical protein
MGCCCAKMPDAEAFLVNNMEGQPAEHLIPGLPQALAMDDWQRLVPDFVSTSVGYEGVGNEHTLSVSDAAGKVVARLRMPRYSSFGVGATMTDAAGTVVAWLRSPHSTRQLPIYGPSYCIFGSRPLVAGQAPSGPDGSYLWATVKANSFGFGCKVFDPTGSPMFTARMYAVGRSPVPFSVQTPSGNGVMVSGKTKEKPSRHEIKVADGADGALSICIMYAYWLIRSEHEKNSN